MINADVAPSRLLSQSDAINQVAVAKISESPETTVGLIVMKNGKSSVAIPNTRESGELMRSLHELKPKGFCNVLNSLKTAQLVLKNRQNKNQKQRIILFIGSPFEEDENVLIRQGKILKKNSVALDVIHFGLEKEKTADSLKRLVDTVNSGDNSHLITIPSDGSSISQKVMATLTSSSNAMEDEMDPDLEMAIQMSLQEAAQDPKTPPPNSEKGAEMEDVLDDDVLANAIAMSLMGDDVEMGKSVDLTNKKETDDHPKKNEMKDEEILADQSFIEDLIDSLPDVDKNEIDISEVMKDSSDGERDNKMDESSDGERDDKSENK